MPKGKHKGARRQFTDFEAESKKKEMQEKEASWRAQRGELPSDESGEGSGSASSSSESEESSSDEEEEQEVKAPKAKGVSGLIEFENPNRQGAKANRKVTDMDTTAATAKPQLSRREREELEKQRATATYRKLHAAGKTDEARADLERLAIIKQRRVEAEEKRKEQIAAKAATTAAKKS